MRRRRASRTVPAFITFGWPLAVATAVFAYLAIHFEMTQDDAYITYRYVANYLDGHGLVFNIGERIEGFTNFAWTIYLLAVGVLHANYIVISKVTGFVCGLGVVVLTYLIALRVFGKERRWYAFSALWLVAANQSLAYWSPAGLETAAFSLATLAALYWYLKRNHLLVFALVMAVGLRPEGAVVTALLLGIEAIEQRGLPRFTLRCALAALLWSLPMVGFKLLYYGSIFPNPFYAKTSFDLLQLQNGLEYAGRFLGHYGFYGFGLIIPLLFVRRLGETARAVWLFTVAYAVYIVLIGGDVLKIHRFFIPVVGPSAVLLVLSLKLLVDLKPSLHLNRLVPLPVAAMLALTLWLPLNYTSRYSEAERGLVQKMAFMADQIKSSDSTNFSVAVSTIGSFSYELLGHDVIDMLGLTDSVIARYSEPPIPGMETTWKEQKHNSRYLLSRAPDYIMLSTGIKPSAPAERALFLYRQFADSYRMISWLSVDPASKAPPILQSAFKRVHPVVGDPELYYPVRYVDFYKAGLEDLNAGRVPLALAEFDSAFAITPRPYPPNLVYQRALALMTLRRFPEAVAAMDSLLVRDSTIFEAHMSLYVIAAMQNDNAKAAIHQRWLMKLVPWLWPQIKARAAEMVAYERRTQQRPSK